MKYRGVIFDLDGVLINSIHLMKKAYNNVIENYITEETSCVPAFEEYCLHMGKRLEDIFLALQIPLELTKVYQNYCLENEHLIEMFPDIIMILEKLYELNIPIAVFTGKDRYRTLRILKNHDIEHFFSCVVTSDDVTLGKPAPEGIFRISEYLQLSPNQLIIIGDSPHDILSGKEAGVGTIGVTWGFSSSEELQSTNPDYIVSEAGQLMSKLYTLLGYEVQAIEVV
ncbi:HAD family hydrolase [Paenibacillus sp. NPDC057934]|uniref:HAD family hydrolase n=1 Tax=Paenibacillus sp. NPDC057934 TaxID=3346282 RepID=UPI0036DF8677